MENLPTQDLQQRSTYTLDHDQLADALDILSEEVEALIILGRRQTKLRPRLTNLIYVTLFAFTAVTILWSHQWLSADATFWAQLIIGAGFVAANFYFGMGVTRALTGLRKVEARLGLPRTKRIVTRAELKKRLPLVFPALVGSTALFAVLILGRSADVSPWSMDIAVLSFMFGIAYSIRALISRNTQLSQVRVETTEQLRDRLAKALEEQRHSESGARQTYSMSEDEYKQIARMERALIKRDRERAIKRSNKKRESSFYAIRQSPGVLEKKARLEPADRLRVQTQIDELSSEPVPPHSYQSDDGSYRLQVPQTLLELKYVMAATSNHIVIDDLVDRGNTSLRDEKI